MRRAVRVIWHPRRVLAVVGIVLELDPIGRRVIQEGVVLLMRDLVRRDARDPGRIVADVWREQRHGADTAADDLFRTIRPDIKLRRVRARRPSRVEHLLPIQLEGLALIRDVDLRRVEVHLLGNLCRDLRYRVRLLRVRGVADGHEWPERVRAVASARRPLAARIAGFVRIKRHGTLLKS